MDRIADPWGPRTPIAAGAPWPERVDEQLAPDAAPELLTPTAWDAVSKQPLSNSGAAAVVKVG